MSEGNWHAGDTGIGQLSTLLYVHTLITCYLSFSNLNSLTTRSVESSKNILHKVVNSHPIAKLDGATEYRPRRCKVVTIILTILIWSSRLAICSAIHVVVDGWRGDSRDFLMRVGGWAAIPFQGHGNRPEVQTTETKSELSILESMINTSYRLLMREAVSVSDRKMNGRNQLISPYFPFLKKFLQPARFRLHLV